MGRFVIEDIGFFHREICHFILTSEYYRGRNSFFQALLKGSMNQYTVVQDLGRQLMYYDRIIPRSELATRVGQLKVSQLKKIYKKYLIDPNLAYATYGPSDFVNQVYDET